MLYQSGESSASQGIFTSPVPSNLDSSSSPADVIYPLRFLLLGDYTIASTALWALRPSTSTVVFDIDGTLTINNFQLLEEVCAPAPAPAPPPRYRLIKVTISSPLPHSQLVLNLLGGKYVPKIQDGAAQVVNAYFQKGYQIVYLTGRPGFLREITLEWLVEEGLPPGMLHMTDSMEQASSKNVGQYKANCLVINKKETWRIESRYSKRN